jgi:hypothetical protein
MMAAMTKHVSETPATQFLTERHIAFGRHPYDYVEHGGTGESAREDPAHARRGEKAVDRIDAW